MVLDEGLIGTQVPDTKDEFGIVEFGIVVPEQEYTGVLSPPPPPPPQLVKIRIPNKATIKIYIFFIIGRNLQLNKLQYSIQSLVLG